MSPRRAHRARTEARRKAARVLRPGDVLGRLTLVERIRVDLEGVASISFARRRVYVWLCRCSCGETTHLRAGDIGRAVQSCGCLTRERSRETNYAQARRYVYRGEIMTLREVAELTGKARGSLYSRVATAGAAPGDAIDAIVDAPPFTRGDMKT